MIKAVILDFGGVLFQNSSDYQGPKGLLEGADKAVWQAARTGQIDDRKLFETIAKHYQVEMKTVEEWLMSRREPNEELIKLVNNLQPAVKKAVINNGLKTLFYSLLDKYYLRHSFDVLVNSAEEGIEKPDPKIYFRTSQRLQVPPGECLFVDDNSELVEAAIGLGMCGIVYKKLADLEAEFRCYGLI